MNQKKAIVKTDIYETIYHFIFLAFPINLRSLIRAFNYIAALEHKVDMC